VRFGKHTLVLSNEQDIGQRERQEDYFGFWADESSSEEIGSALLVVSDGMGGHDGGDAASVVALEAFITFFVESDLPIFERLEMGAREANARVFELATGTGRDVGCTLVALYLTPETYQWISIGDSVLCRIRDGKLARLNRDHNLGNQLDAQLAEGIVTEEYAAGREAEREHLTSNLGLEAIPEIDITDPFPVLAGDQFVLASDGLSNTLSWDRMEQIAATGEPDDTAGLLVQGALSEENPKQDNITVVTVAIVPSADVQDG
jgi:serine/threonine protein phosphatase PrpC